jgi:hypothetical protein
MRLWDSKGEKNQDKIIPVFPLWGIWNSTLFSEGWTRHSNNSSNSSSISLNLLIAFIFKKKIFLFHFSEPPPREFFYKCEIHKLKRTHIFGLMYLFSTLLTPGFLSLRYVTFGSKGIFFIREYKNHTNNVLRNHIKWPENGSKILK